jgi:Gamma-glutamyl cyclotransferase, AIG2-like
MYFAYGATMDPRLMAGRAPGARSVGPARPEGFRLAFDVASAEWEGGVANLEPDRDAGVWGVLWEVPEDEAEALEALGASDRSEGHPTSHRAEDVVVHGPGGPVPARVHRVLDRQGVHVPPTDAYLNRLRSAVRVQGLPPEALDAIDEAAGHP